MADGKKVYTLNINGVQESIDAVNSLLGQLDKLESKMDELSKKNIVVNTSGGGNKAVSELDAQEKLQRKIIDNADKIAMARDKDYEVILRQKEKLKEITSEQKATLAQAQLTNKEYSNTMQGLKQRLADIKAVLQVADLNDTDAFEKLTKEANELNQKLKDIEYSYGQFGRNVGNYQSAAEGFKKFSIEVNGVTREFDSAKQALMELRKESDTLRAMGEDVGDLDEKVKGLDSTLKDLKKSSLVLDNMLDMMESFASMASVGQGFKSLFGIDNEDLEKGIQKLLALQNVLQGIEKINMQIKTSEGLGKYFNGMAKSVDKATSSMLAYSKSMLGTGAASKVAALGIRALGAALKTIPVMAAIYAVSQLVDWFGKLADKKKDVVGLVKTLNEIGEASKKAFVQGEAKLKMFQARIKDFNGSAKEEKKLVDELNSSLGDRLGHYKSIKQWQEALIKLSPYYLKILQNEAEVEALMNKYGELRLKQIDLENKKRNFTGETAFTQNSFWGMFSKGNKEAAEYAKINSELEETNRQLALVEDNMNVAGKAGVEMAEEVAEAIKSLGGTLETDTKKGTDKAKETYDQAAQDLIKRRIANMKDGLRKVLMQLTLEENQEIEKISKAEHLKGERQLEIQNEYQRKRLDAIKEFGKKAAQALSDAYEFEQKAMSKEISNQLMEEEQDWGVELETFRYNFFKGFSKMPLAQGATMEMFETIFGIPMNKKNLEILKEYSKLLDELAMAKGNFLEYKDLFGEESKEAIEMANDVTALAIQLEMFKNEYKDLKTFFDNPMLVTALIENFETSQKDFIDSLDKRSDALAKHYQEEEDLTKKHYDKLLKLNLKDLREQYQMDLPEEERKQYKEALEEYEKIMAELDDAMESEREKNKEDYRQKLISLEEYLKRDTEIQAKYNDKRIGLDESLNNILRENNAEFAAKEQELIDATEKKRVEASENANDKIIDSYSSTYNILSDMVSEFQNGLLNDDAVDSLGQAIAAQIKNVKDKLGSLDLELGIGKIEVETYNKETEELTRILSNLLTLLRSYVNKRNESEGEQVNEDVDPVYQFDGKGGGKDFDWKKFWQQVIQIGQSYLQYAADIMASFDELEQYYLDKQIDALEKQNEALEKKYEENEEILEKHKSNVESIEDELANARGDRREYLISQLNQEIEAQREAAKEQQRIEKEQEALERQKEAMERQKAMKQYEANLKQMQISGIMSILNAFATQPFLPMGAALGAAQTIAVAIQIANAKKMKPYESGGQLEGGVAVGKRHKDGGIPVLGGRSVIEGGEFITNRRSTAKNLDVLSFINSSKKRLDINDFIEFYSKPKAVVKNLTPKFANGGELPTIGNLDISNQLKDMVLVQSEQPIYVAVTEIEDKMNHLNNVRAIAGDR